MRTKTRSLIVQPGAAACIHYELIEGLVGTCLKCGQIKDYRILYADEPKGTISDKNSISTTLRRKRLRDEQLEIEGMIDESISD